MTPTVGAETWAARFRELATILIYTAHYASPDDRLRRRGLPLIAQTVREVAAELESTHVARAKTGSQ